jgi:hypothetical protein
MSHPKETPPWIAEAISAWKSDRIRMQPGATPAMIAEAEEKLDFKFPADFISLYLRVNGFVEFEMNNMISLWPLDVIVQEYNAEGENIFIGFCDFLINSHSIGFLRDGKGIFMSIDRQEPVADTFREVIKIIHTGSRLLT